jgi:hypothetical protein
MTIKLSKAFAANKPVSAADVYTVKHALNRLGYYMPNAKLGMTDIPDRAVFSSLKSFQKVSGLRSTGEMRPNDVTLNALSEVSENAKGQYIWRTVGDEKVRESHAALEGKVMNLSDAPLPGQEENCRCWVELLPDDPPIEPVYPELLMLPFIRLGWLAKAWKAWLRNKKPEWRLGQHKSAERWARQMEKRGWTPDKITNTIQNGRQFPAPNHINPGNGATRFEHKGNYVVKDDVTNEIIQVGSPEFVRPMINRR